MRSLRSIVLIVFILVTLTTVNSLPECNQTEIQFFRSPCDEDGSQFIIQIPKNNEVCEVKDSKPSFLKNCRDTCSPGQAIDLINSACTECKIGTAAAGDTYLVESWKKLPTGFYSDFLGLAEHTNCKKYGWIPKGSYIKGTCTPECASELTVENYNIKAGEVTFEYKFSDELALAYFTIRNKRCVLDQGKSHILPRTSNYYWKKYTLSVPEGSSILQWYLFSDNVYGLQNGKSTFKIRSVRITGRIPDIQCPKCEPGFYSNVSGATECKPCPANHKSGRGAEICDPCPEHQYAPEQSAICIDRKPCQESEYIRVYSKCSVDNEVNLKNRLIEPVICDKNAPISMPTDSAAETCLLCPSGSKPLNNTHCKSCLPGEISIQGVCQTCPKDEAPIFGLNYTTWHRMPDFMQSYCMDYNPIQCMIWQPNGTSIFVGPGLDNHVSSSLVLNIAEGFLTSQTMSTFTYPYAIIGTKLVVDFEVICKGYCHLHLRRDSKSESESIYMWSGEVKRQLFEYSVTEAERANFEWTFEKNNLEEDELKAESRSDRVIIYSIYVTNTDGTGAIGCKLCPLGVENSRCRPCADGLYYTLVKNINSTTTSAKCMPCPNGTIAITDATSTMTVQQACKPCPAGTRPGNNNQCQTDLEPGGVKGRTYSFRKIIKPMEILGSKLFTYQGHAYMHRYKFFFDTGNKRKRVRCFNDENEDISVSSWVCRETLILDQNEDVISNATFRASPIVLLHLKRIIVRRRSISPHEQQTKDMYHGQVAKVQVDLGDTLEKALSTNSSPEYAKEINALLVKSGWKSDDGGNDYHFHFKTKASTGGCKRGMSSVITLRCTSTTDVSLATGSTNMSSTDFALQVPPKCTDGTCDGCLYHFMVLSQHACPLCSSNDYQRIEGSCNSGSREVHLIPVRTCRMPSNVQTFTTESCPLLSTQGKLAIGLTLSVVLVLVLVIFYCHRRNKKLEYKYMKLFEGAEARVKNSMGSGSPSSDQGQGTGCGILEDEADLEFRHGKSISAISTGKAPLSFEAKNGGFGPVIFRRKGFHSNVADDSHILTLDDCNTTENI